MSDSLPTGGRSARKRTKSQLLIEAERDALPGDTEEATAAAVPSGAAAPPKRKRIATSLKSETQSESEEIDELTGMAAVVAAASAPTKVKSKLNKSTMKSKASSIDEDDDEDEAADEWRPSSKMTATSNEDEEWHIGSETKGSSTTVAAAAAAAVSSKIMGRRAATRGDDDDDYNDGEGETKENDDDGEGDEESEEDNDEGDGDLLVHLPTLSTSSKSKNLPSSCIILVVVAWCGAQRREYWSLPYSRLSQINIKLLMQLNGIGMNPTEKLQELKVLWGRKEEQFGWRETILGPPPGIAGWNVSNNGTRQTKRSKAVVAAAASTAAAQEGEDADLKSEDDGSAPASSTPLASLTTALLAATSTSAASASASSSSSAPSAVVSLIPSPSYVYWGANGWRRIDVIQFDTERPERKQPTPIAIQQHVAMMFHIAFP